VFLNIVFYYCFLVVVVGVLIFCGKGRAAGTGPPHPLGVPIGYLIAGKDGFGSTAACAS